MWWLHVVIGTWRAQDQGGCTLTMKWLEDFGLAQLLFFELDLTPSCRKVLHLLSMEEEIQLDWFCRPLYGVFRSGPWTHSWRDQILLLLIMCRKVPKPVEAFRLRPDGHFESFSYMHGSRKGSMKCCGLCRASQRGSTVLYFVLQVETGVAGGVCAGEGLLSPGPVHIPVPVDGGEGRLIAELCLYGLVGQTLTHEQMSRGGSAGCCCSRCIVSVEKITAPRFVC